MYRHLAPILSIVVGCGTPAHGPAPAGTPVSIAPIATDMRPYVTGLFEQGPEMATPLVIRTPEEWAAVMRPVLGAVLPRPPLPAVNFARETIVGYALGRRSPMSGPAPAIAGAVQRGDTLVVVVRITGCPRPDDGSAAPVALARAPWHEGPVAFVTDSAPCSAGP